MIKLSGHITCEDEKNLEIEVETACGPVLLVVEKNEGCSMCLGDWVQLILEEE